MKYLTLDLFERIVDAFHEQTRLNLKLIGHATRDECRDYIGYYGLHGGLFWSEQSNKICGIATAHPGEGDIDWEWKAPSGVWTTHCVWASNKRALADLIGDFLKTRDVIEFHAWRQNKSTPLTLKKLERILFYGREQNHNSGPSDAKLRAINGASTTSANQVCSPDLCSGSKVSAALPATSK